MPKPKIKPPKVKSVGTVDFNVNTKAGKAAYNKALKASKGLKTDKARDAATTKALHGDYNRGVKAGKRAAAAADKDEFDWKKWGDAAAKGEELAAEAKRQRTLTGYSPQASSINKGGSGVYNYQPKQMSDKPGDTSPMVRFDSDYEKQKRSMGL